ncbi:MAG: hypothetical protein HYZ22_04165 [Chloroflexi bacterium]|nr:hypothetical protein [Chloroflexota bacterium]
MVVPLVEPKITIQQSDPFPVVPARSGFHVMPSSNKRTTLPTDNLKQWLTHMGLNLNPFGYIDAGEDPFIPFYLIDHNQFKKINGDQISFVFAPAGGGKTAFRVRLARECRAGWNKRRIFPIIFKPTEPGVSQGEKSRALRQQADLLRYAARELFIYLAYSPYALDEMNDALRNIFIQTISWDLDFPIAFYFDQMKTAGSLEPILAAFDPTARSLPNPPDKEDILYLYKKLTRYIPEPGKPDEEHRLEALFDLILNKLKFEAIYILVDGVDAFPETENNPHNALLSISWLLDNAISWSNRGVYTKYFLPKELKQFVDQTTNFRPLTLKSKIITIKWDADALSEVIRRRLQEASGGKFDSLAAISDRALRASERSLEEVLIGELRRHKKLSPRSLIKAMDYLFVCHIQDGQVHEKLTPQDVTAVREWIRREYSVKK